MRTMFLLISLVCCQFALAQKDSITLDQLQVPSSPAFTILDISPNSIERPKNPTDFAVTLNNATSGFTSFPKNFAMELSPFWVFGNRKATYESFKSNRPGDNILQTAIVSVGTKDAISIVDSSEFRKVAIALKFSIWRGKLGTQFEAWDDSLHFYLRRLSVITGQRLIDLQKADPVYNDYFRNLQEATNAVDTEKKTKYQKLITDRNNELEAALKKSLDSLSDYKKNADVLKELVSRTDFNRYGFKMDYAIGTAIDYPGNNFSSSYASKLSTWLTLGFEKEKGLNVLAVVRYNYNINRWYRNQSDDLVRDINIGELDYGIRVYSDVTSKFTLSFEAIKRKKQFNESKLKSNNISLPENSDRYVFSANYKVGKNQNLAFTYGKNFNNELIKEGNLLAALNFIIGFGSARP